MPGPGRRPLGEVHLSVDRAPIMRLSRTLSNRTWEQGAYGAIYRANLRIVRATQEAAVRLLEARIERPTQTTGKLAKAIASKEAVYADANHIVVGVAAYLDRVASYWRPVEEGAPGLMGRIAYGFWTNAPRSERGRVAVEGPVGGVNTGRPLILEWDSPPFNMRRYFAWIIEHPTQAHWFFLDAWNEVVESTFPEHVYREEFAKATGPGGKPISLPASFRALHGRSLSSRDFRF